MKLAMIKQKSIEKELVILIILVLVKLFIHIFTNVRYFSG